MDFHTLRTQVAANFHQLSQGLLLRTSTEKDTLWDTYLSSWPAEMNPFFRKRTEHDCSCCRQFIKAIGNVTDGKGGTIWGSIDHPVAKAMHKRVLADSIVDIFLHDAPTAGTDKSFEDTVNGVHTWTHFFVNVPRQFLVARGDRPTKLGEARDLRNVFIRGLKEIKPDTVETVLDLIAQNSLYRGEEHRHTLTTFQTLQKQFARLASEAERELFGWTTDASVPVKKIRNTSIGTLLTELSEGMDLEDAVKRFEAMVAPQNYRRTTALVTPKMIEQAKATVAELGLTSALSRRYAQLTDITVNNILFADRAAKAVINGDVFDMLTPSASKPNLDKIEEVSIDTFVSNILPKVDSIEVLLEGKHAGNLVSLIAPQDPTAGQLFKWSNAFSWAYVGDVADSIKERVKKAGGNVTGDLCIRLAWSNYDDLDLHVHEPRGGHISYQSRGHVSPAGGDLDVDANGGSATTRTPVENIFYVDRRKMLQGPYRVTVNQFQRRESADVGFEIEIDCLGSVTRIACPKSPPASSSAEVAVIDYDKTTDTFKVSSRLPMNNSAISKNLWGLPSENFHRVTTVMMSPNYWDGQLGVGNRHFFFMLDGMKNEEGARGFYNEFLATALEPHRKVLEMVGAKTKVPEAAEQLSGVGFSSTGKGTLICRVKGSFTRTLKIIF